jgi:hypothetical protein
MAFVELARDIKNTANFYGGCDTDWSSYSTSDTKNYSEKGGHKERSIHFSQQHRKHFRKTSFASSGE